MPRKILVFFMSMVLLGGYGISVCRAQDDSDVDQIPMYWLQGTVFVDDVALTPTTNNEHKEYTLVPIVRRADPATPWTELTEYKMGSKNQDVYELKIYDDDQTDGVTIQKSTNFEMRIAIYMKGDKSTQLDVNIGTSAGEPWYVGKNVVGEFFAEADVYAYIPPGQPEDLQAAATASSEIHNINLQWTAPGDNNGVGTVSSYLARLSTSDITTEGQWDAATPLTTGWTSLKPAGSTENRTAISASALDPNGTYYVALRAVDAAGTPGPFMSAQVNMPPKATSVAIAPSNPPDAETTDNLLLTYSYSDPEGDPESGTKIRWYKVIGGNDVLQPAYSNQTLPSSATKKGEIWKASVQPANANGMGLEVKSNSLTIINTPPVANPNGPYSSKIDSAGTTVLPITFNGSGSSDVDGDTLEYAWNFGDGETGTGVSPTHTYAPLSLVLYPKIYNVTLTVSDDEDDSVPVSTTATVTINALPEANAGGPYEGIAGEPLTFDGSGSTDADDTAPDDLVFTWDFENDATPDFVSPRGTPTAEHTYPSHGSYTASLVVSDYLDNSAPDTASVLVKARPVANFTWPADPQEGSPVNFTDASTDADGTVVAWSWDFDADGVEESNLQNPSYTYMDNGDYPVTLTVTDNDTLESTVELAVTVSDLGPTAGFNWAPEPQVEGSAVDFADTSTSYPDDIVAWAWDFGDGGTSTEQNPSYIFMDDGTYTVTLKVTDDDGSTDTVDHDVTIDDASPTAAFTWAPEPQVEGSLVQFTDTSTSPADVIDTWAWDFDDGGTSTDQNPTHTFMDDGTYTVTLKVTDDDGSVSPVVQHDVTITDAIPTAAFSWSPDPQDEGSEVQFTDESTTPADDIVSWCWDFDDGTPMVYDQNPPHTFVSSGVYTVSLAVTDDDDSTNTVQHDVTISDVPPTAEFLWSPDPQDEGSPVQFTDKSTALPVDQIMSRSWDFDASDGIQEDSTEQHPSHTFMDDGTYTVTLTVTDDDDSTDTVQHDVTVSDLGPTAAFTWTPEPQVEGTAVDFTDASTSAPDDIVSWEWDFDDGGTSTAQNPSYIFVDDGTYTVSLTVTDDDGSTDTVQHDVTITDAEPTAAFTWTPEPQVEGSAVDFTDASTSPADAIVSWSWDFDNDGTEDSNLQNPSHTFMDDGIYTVTLTVTDDDGDPDTVQNDVTITDGVPTAAFTWTPEPQAEGSPVQFTDTSTSPADVIDTWAWDFADSTSTEQNPSHVYADNGAYTVTLTVTDDDEDSDTTQNTVNIENVAPVVDAGPGDLEVPVKQPVNITVEFSDVGTADTHTATIDWDDGTVEPGSVSEVNGSGTVTGSHMYAAAGEFDVVITITDDDGAPVTHSMKITVIGIEVLAVTFNVLEQTLIVELDEPVEPDLTNFELIGMEVSDSGKWDIQLPPNKLPITEQGPSKILHIDMKRNLVAAPSLSRAGLVKFLPVDFLAQLGAFGDAAGSLSIEVTGADDMRITMVANGFILGTLGDVSGNGKVTAFDAALIARAAAEGLSALPIYSTGKQVDALVPGANIAKDTADVDKDGDVDARDALEGLRLAAYGPETAPPNMASDTKKCRLSVNSYDSGKLDVSIDVEDVSGVYCADIVMSYDPGTLTVADVSRTSSISDWVFADAAESGKLRIAMAGLSQPVANGSLVNISVDAASADAIKELQIVELKLNGGRSRAEVENLPKVFALMPNYPNPFNPETWIPYQLTVPANVTVSIYNLNGQIVRRLELGNRMPGSYVERSRAAYWDGRNESGEMVSSGIYFYQLQAGRDAAVRKMVIVK